MTPDISQLKTVLKKRHSSLTVVRRTVFEILALHDALTMAELIDKVGAVADRASVYRTIQLFEGLGIVHRLQIGWKYKLELSDAFVNHHHHLTCLNCGKVIPLNEDATLEKELMKLADENNFEATGHQLEIRGYCSDCQIKMTPAISQGRGKPHTSSL